MSENSPNTLRLPAVLDVSMAANLKTDLEAAFARNEQTEVDASDVLRISSACLQVLLAASRKGGLVFGRVSPALLETASMLALSPAFGLRENAHE